VAKLRGPQACPRGEIVVLAGTNGAGKSSVAGAALTQGGTEFYNPDEATRRYVAAGLPVDEANARAWDEGRRLLERAIRERLDFAFETTLGGHTMTALLLEAAKQGLHVRIFYVGLASLELHIQRVRERVARGGHDIPEHRIRARWEASRENLIRLLPHVAELAVWDNSAEADPDAGELPAPVRILSMQDRTIRDLCPLAQVPTWAKPIVAAALECDPSAATGS
jgi:predicted ABC-type ATPase